MRHDQQHSYSTGLPLLVIKSAVFSIALYAILGKAGCAPHPGSRPLPEPS